MNSAEFQNKTKKLGLGVIRFVEVLPQNNASRVIINQILRCALSVGANYRAVCRAKSDKDFIHKMKIVEEECDETIYWLEIIEESGLAKVEPIAPLRKEAREILAMIVASIDTVSKNLKSKQSEI
ncbi:MULTISPECIES: four helix bundle protein [Butyricimonas]|uniref:four helix bundle protein n=1 Tax=Butyricimonas TaxID=574697 RepID=UPI001D091AA5|nr:MULTISPECIES: four helix bundle protein [Butyricimonas]MCB6974619.1 four helix bundle protein [Butyricimonas synergistica]MCG4521361.1 four helix bundle protein [Butyricimonas sp. DFI.6.44]